MRQFDQLSERYLNINRRIYSPRNFQLSREFVEAFRKEMGNQLQLEEERRGEKFNARRDRAKLYEKICKSLRFHINN